MSDAGRLKTTMRQFVVAIGLLTGPSVIGAGLSFLSTPLLVSWFSPRDFGETASALAVASILAGVVTLRLDILIYRPVNSGIRTDITRLAFGVTLAISALLLLVLAPIYLTVTGWNVAGLSRAGLTFMMTVSLGIAAVGTAYQVSRGNYLWSSVPKVVTPIAVLAVAGCATLLHARGVDTLLIANVIGLIAAALLFLPGPLRAARTAGVGTATGLLDRERRYMMFAVPQSAVSSASFLNLFMLITSSCYGPAIAGQQFLAFRLVGFPSTILGAAAGNLLSAKAIEIREHGLWPYLLGMAGVGLLIYGPLLALLPLLPLHLVPTRWRGAVAVLPPMIVLCFVQFVFGSFGQLMLVWNRAGQFLAWDIARLVLTCVAGIIVWRAGGSYVLATWVFVVMHVITFVALGRLVTSAAASDRLS